jgi:hypothetical protein
MTNVTRPDGIISSAYLLALHHLLLPCVSCQMLQSQLERLGTLWHGHLEGQPIAIEHGFVCRHEVRAAMNRHAALQVGQVVTCHGLRHEYEDEEVRGVMPQQRHLVQDAAFGLELLPPVKFGAWAAVR